VTCIFHPLEEFAAFYFKAFKREDTDPRIVSSANSRYQIHSILSNSKMPRCGQGQKMKKSIDKKNPVLLKRDADVQIVRPNPAAGDRWAMDATS
jgi:hypothetical protein